MSPGARRCGRRSRLRRDTYKTAHYFDTYYNYDCNPKTGACSPGIVLNYPNDEDVTTFRLNADVVNDPLPTTSMKVYLMVR